MLRNQLVGGVVALALLCPARSSWAAGPDEAAAEALFRSGKQLMGERKFAEACPKLAESFRLDAATGTQLALALCYEQWGKLASAWSTYATAADRSKQEGRADRERAARARAAALEPKLSRLTVNVDAASAALAGLTVSRNGVNIGSASFGVPLPVDPEEITVEANAPGRQPWSAKVTVGPNADQKVVTVPPLEENRSGASVQAVKPAPAAPAEAPPAGSSGPSAMRIGAYAAGGAGIIGLGLGGFFGLRAISKNGDSEDKGCDGDRCSTEEGKKLRDDAVSAGNVATVATIAGVVLAGAGVTLFVLDLNKKKSPRADGAGRVELVPVVGRGDAGFSLVGTF
ncbi:MAG TPA: hypothetical protein VFS00_32240 [Polyangiaceae bacterium]|nr:hypothetical protein [Polyangiaceae bacterium]